MAGAPHGRTPWGWPAAGRTSCWGRGEHLESTKEYINKLAHFLEKVKYRGASRHHAIVKYKKNNEL